MNYDIIARALNTIAEQSHYDKVTAAIRRYVNDPTLEVPAYITEYSRLLIEIGRERPMYFVKLLEIVEQIRMGTGDPQLYTEEQWQAIDDAFNALYDRDRPTKLITAIKEAAASELPWKSALQKTDLKPFAPLVKLYRGSPEKFEDMVKMREYLRCDELRKNLNARRKGLRDRRSKLAVIVQFKNKWFDVSLVSREADQKLVQAMEMRHAWVKQRTKGETAVEASNKYWELYDQQLDDSLAMVERAKRGASVIAKEVKYPIVQRTK